MDRSEKDRVKIFDTTLRDGEQSPGISLNKQEKLEIAHQLARLRRLYVRSSRSASMGASGDLSHDPSSNRETQPAPFG